MVYRSACRETAPSVFGSNMSGNSTVVMTKSTTFVGVCSAAAITGAGEADGFIQFPPEIELSMPVVDDPDMGITELIDIAIERERRAALIYENAAAVMAGSFKGLLEGLAAFEKEHEEKLKSFKSYY